MRGLEALLEVEPIYFRYRTGNPLGLPTDREYVGIRAQDAERVVPEAVSKDSRGYRHVTTDALFWTLWNAVRELYGKWTDESQDLRREISGKADAADVAHIKAELERVKAENASLKAYLCRNDPSAPICQ